MLKPKSEGQCKNLDIDTLHIGQQTAALPMMSTRTGLQEQSAQAMHGIIWWWLQHCDSGSGY